MGASLMSELLLSLLVMMIEHLNSTHVGFAIAHSLVVPYHRTGFNCANLTIMNCEFFWSSQNF